MASACISCGGLVSDLGRACSNCGHKGQSTHDPPLSRPIKAFLFGFGGLLMGGLGSFMLFSPHQAGNGDPEMILAVLLITASLGSLAWGYRLLH